MPIKPAPLPPWWIGWVALMLLAFGTPCLVARLIELPGNPIRIALLEGKPVSDAALDVLEKSREPVVGWFPRNETLNDLAMAAVARADRAQTPDRAKVFLKQAEIWERQALSISPADAYGWFRLAYIFLNGEGKPSSRSAAAWQQSLASAPYEPSIALPRLEMGIALGPYLSPEARAYLPVLAREAETADVKRLAQSAKAGSFVATVESALENDPNAFAAFRDELRFLNEK